MLLVISMEEGGDNLSAFSVPLTEALGAAQPGYRFKTDAITLTIVPLLLTVLLIALIAQLARRFGTRSAWIRGRSGLLGSRKHLLRQKHKYRNR